MSHSPIPSFQTSAAGRRSRMLAELDIDVWQRRGEPIASGEAASSAAAPPAAPPAALPAALPAPLPAAGGSGPAAARALLEASMSGVGANSPAVAAGAVSPHSLIGSSIDASAEGAAVAADAVISAPPTDAKTDAPAVAAEEPLDLWCLSGPHGVLLANFAGLAPAEQRLLNDVFQATMRLVAAATGGMAAVSDKAAKPAKLKVQQLRFSWPPPEQSGQSVPADAAAPVSRALRGFLNRQLEAKPNPVILLGAAQLHDRLADIELPVGSDRLIDIGAPDQLVGNAAAKRALWETLTSL